MSMNFVVCGGCGRHVREGDAACPFCGGACVREASAAASTSARAALATALAVAAGLGLQACYGGPPRPRSYTEDQHRPGGAVMQVATTPERAK